MKTLLATGAVLLLAAVSASADKVSESGHATYFTTLTEGLAHAGNTDQPVVLKFYTDW